MAKVVIDLPDELLLRAQQADIDLSPLVESALLEELDRVTKLYELDAYLAELETELGPMSAAERNDTRAWVNALLGTNSAPEDWGNSGRSGGPELPQ